MKSTCEYEIMKWPYQKELTRAFPEFNCIQVPHMLENLKNNKPEIIATCRYEHCRNLHQNEILHWKANIAQTDLDYKGTWPMSSL